MWCGVTCGECASFVVVVAHSGVSLYRLCVHETPLAAVPLCGSVCCLTSAPAAPPPHRPPEPCSNRSPLIVPDELLYFPANVRRGDLCRPGGVISTHSLGCCQRGRCQEPAWIGQGMDWSSNTMPGPPTPSTLTACLAPRPLLLQVGVCCHHTSLSWALGALGARGAQGEVLGHQL